MTKNLIKALTALDSSLRLSSDICLKNKVVAVRQYRVPTVFQIIFKDFSGSYQDHIRIISTLFEGFATWSGVANYNLKV